MTIISFAQDGVHERREKTEPEHTEAQLKLMFSQDLKYVNMKRSTELKVGTFFIWLLGVFSLQNNPKNRDLSKKTDLDQGSR